MKRFDNEQLKGRLINLRQNPDYPELKDDIRKAVRYIEKLEYALNDIMADRKKRR